MVLRKKDLATKSQAQDVNYEKAVALRAKQSHNLSLAVLHGDLLGSSRGQKQGKCKTKPKRIYDQ